MIRLAQKTDLPAINEIYNQAVMAKFETADIDQVSNAERLEWFKKHEYFRYPVFVYELNGSVVAWLSVSPYREGRRALTYTAEISYYVHKKYLKQGIGSNLVSFILPEAVKLGYKSLIAIVLDKNQASIRLLKKHGFREWGHLPSIADFDGEECGHLYYGLKPGVLNSTI